MYRKWTERFLDDRRAKTNRKKILMTLEKREKKNLYSRQGGENDSLSFNL